MQPHYNDILARKYALAFLNVFENTLTDSVLEHIAELESFIEQHKSFYVALRIPNIPNTTKHKALQKVAQAFKLPKNLEHLMVVLLNYGHIEILDDVLYYISREYEKRHHVEHFTVRSSHELSQDQKDLFVRYLAKLTPSAIHAQFTCDPSLIVGIRAESIRWIWERSIRKKLLLMKQAILSKGVL